jgi:outer membrane immunogenic protein
MKKILLSSVALLGLSVAAQAADLPRRTMAPAPMVAAAPVFTWTGFYFGVNAGYAWSDNGDEDDSFRLERNAVFPGSAPGRFSFRDHNGEEDGFAGGAQIGWNYQFTPGTGFVVGIEADIQGLDIDRDNFSTVGRFDASGPGTLVTPGNFVAVRSSAASLDYFGTVRGRLGYAFDRLLVYGTGGFAYGGGDRNNGCPQFVDNNFTGRFCNDGDETRYGYAVGGGFEWALPLSAVNFFGSTAVTFGVEGLYVNLDDDDDDNRNLVGFTRGTGTPVFVADRNRDNETEFGVVRAKINFKF